MASRHLCRRGYATTFDSSASLEEAKERAMSFFKDCCRALPHLMDIYILHETISLSDLRSIVSAQFRKHQNIQNPKVGRINTLCVNSKRISCFFLFFRLISFNCDEILLILFCDERLLFFFCGILKVPR